DQLMRAGCFKLLLPPSHGGLGADLPAVSRVLENLARADASVGWTVMIGASAWLDLVGMPRSSFDGLFPADRDVIVAGAFAPTGQISPVDGGYRVTGRWGFACGCEHAVWLWGNCVEDVVDGVPQLRGAVFAPGQVVIEDTWTVSGLAGTGSHHFHVNDLDVPADMTFPVDTDDPCLDEIVVRIPIPALLSVEIASVALGTARGALDDIVALAADKVPLFDAAPLAANPLFQRELATADVELRAARALLDETTGSMWATAASGQPVTLGHRARIRAAAVWVTERAARAVGTAYRAGGGTSIYADCPLQRRLRDIHALTQHFLVKPDTLTTAGAILAGQDPGVPVF
ncbi:MAG TPA: acyl-CoA dehydrogenase family protein, partial [Acidimicrobiales bacterium]|nr:acyl-CoA dehydrogenase family protein [Acidimicrobiales bacterium]